MNGCSAILLAAGRSKRLGFDKILTPLAGRPVLAYSLEALARSPEVVEILLVTRPDIAEEVGRIAAETAAGKPWRIVEGGAERQDSVWSGLQAVPQDSGLVAIHDAARPLLTPEMVATLVAAARESGSAVCARPATDTLKEAGADGVVVRTIDRSRFWQVETPQVFERRLITEAYRKVQEEKLPVTDDASAVEITGREVRLVAAGLFNLKITRPADWLLLELWLQRERGASIRTELHQLANVLSPVVGYLPLLEKHGGDSPKFREYVAKTAAAAASAEGALRRVQELVRQVHPDRVDQG